VLVALADKLEEVVAALDGELAQAGWALSS